MLVYHPAFDLYNCIFRMLCLLQRAKEDEINLEKLRIWDFYLAFPNQVKTIAFPSNLRKLKDTIFKNNNNPYEQIPDTKIVFDRMINYQTSALNCLASYGFIDAKSLSKNIVKKTNKILPKKLDDQIKNISQEKENVLKLVVNEFVDLPLYGSKGLKARTGLIDFKYDPRN